MVRNGWFGLPGGRRGLDGGRWLSGLPGGRRGLDGRRWLSGLTVIPSSCRGRVRCQRCTFFGGRFFFSFPMANLIPNPNVLAFRRAVLL